MFSSKPTRMSWETPSASTLMQRTKAGYEPGPQNFGYLFRVHVQDTDEKAYEVGKGFLSGNAGVRARAHADGLHESTGIQFHRGTQKACKYQPAPR